MNEERKFYSNPGSPIKTIYSPKINDDGTFDLVETGKENVQEYIDSFAEETCMAYIIKKCEMGDTSVLSKRQGTYGDFTEIPKTYRDLLQTVIDGRTYFESLPVEVRSKFGHSFEQWFAQIGSKEWFDVMESMTPVEGPIPEVPIKESEVKE